MKNHTIYIDDEKSRDRMVAFINSTSDRFATEIYHHESCWKKYLRSTYDTSDLKTIHLQNIRLPEMNQIFFEHVRNVIIELNEPRTLRSLLLDYQNITKKIGISIENMKSSKVKELIQETFGEEIGFHERYHKNESIIVFKRNAGGSFIEFAIYSWGISEEQILHTAAKRLRAHLKDNNDLGWPPTVEEVERDEEPDPLLYKVICWLKNPADKIFELNPESLMLSSLFKSHLTKK